MSEYRITHIANPYPVYARKIVNVIGTAPGGALNMTLDDGRTYTAGTEMTMRHFPVSGDYLIIGEDGYPYINPAEVFERKYRAVDDGKVTVESIMVADLSDTRFHAGDDVVFQANVGRIGTDREYDGAVPAHVIAAYIKRDQPHYDIEVFDDSHGDACWHPLTGVSHLMVIPVPDMDQLGDIVSDREIDEVHVRALALEQAAKTYDVHGVRDVLDAARAYELFLLGYAQEQAPAADPMPAPKTPASAPVIAETVPNDGPRVTTEMLSEHVENVYYINPRQALLALGGEDNPELDRATFCLLSLRSGALVIGTSIVSSLENVDENSGRKMAQQDAVNRLSDYLGFVMKHTS